MSAVILVTYETIEYYRNKNTEFEFGILFELINRSN